ncbi:hypothetical protein ACROYT_G021102 [Oculina patagonica]
MSDCNSTRRTERRILKEFNSSLILESLSCGKRASMRTLSKAMPMNSISWEGLIVLDATTGASRDINTRSRVLKLVKNANLDGSAMTKSSVHDVNNKLEAIVTFKDPFKPVRQLIEKERGTSKPKGLKETSFGCCTTEIRLGEMEVDVIRSTSSKTIIHYLDAQFARHGLPRGLRSDNGSNLVSKEVEGYLKESEIEHHDTTPLWPRANGQVERQNKTLLKSVRAAHAKGKNWREELNRFLLAYRSTPHSTTGKSPAELLFRSKLKTKMPELVDLEEEEIEVSDQGIRDQDTQRKQSGKDYADKRFHARDRNVREGDNVSLEKKNETSCRLAMRMNHIRTKPFNMPDQKEHGAPLQDAEPPTEPKTAEISPMKENPVPTTDSPPDLPAAIPTAEQPVRRSDRISTHPKALNDNVLH